MTQTRNQSEKRRFIFRPETRNLVHFFVLGDRGGLILQGMGKTLNISRGGVLLEIHTPIPEGSRVQLSIGIEDDILELDAITAHIRTSREGTIYIGFAFLPMTGPKARLLSLFIQRFEEYI
ncbi:PilZ domain-containing protein [Desulfobotulus sp. H1]|uniref:PilZ domain-containing protein n=1 Tax=Desulfobotulus pelophilus TaxID=2823377 RepID=A0ABT3NCF3_9BACT|nr:PilZ domain-containing protein [Desulfobotulus pelophilus]MCW7755144.1 PilZ domain-containing protein [Desulfobotulus pelophilus]